MLIEIVKYLRGAEVIMLNRIKDLTRGKIRGYHYEEYKNWSKK